MKFFKKAVFFATIGSLATIGAMSLLACQEKDVNDLKNQQCSLLKKIKGKINKN